MLVLHTIARHYKKLDQPVTQKSRASSRHADSKSDLRPKTGDSAKDNLSNVTGQQEEVEHQILNKEKI
jgi:DNA-directed RNA polymerase subunit F